METFKEIWAFMRVRKKFWLAPIILTLMLLAALFFVAGQSGVMSPFLYALF
jgi:Na+/melibiose symporter-like transporter